MSNGMIVLAGALVVVGAMMAMQWWMKAQAMRAKGAPSPVAGDGLFFFHSPTCAPCHAMRPHVEALAAERDDVRSVDVSEEPEIAGAFGVMATPTVMVVRDGVVADVHVGALSAGALQRLAG